MGTKPNKSQAAIPSLFPWMDTSCIPYNPLEGHGLRSLCHSDKNRSVETIAAPSQQGGKASHHTRAINKATYTQVNKFKFFISLRFFFQFI
jgi:hypothetical protein